MILSIGGWIEQFMILTGEPLSTELFNQLENLTSEQKLLSKYHIGDILGW